MATIFIRLDQDTLDNNKDKDDGRNPLMKILIQALATTLFIANPAYASGVIPFDQMQCVPELGTVTLAVQEIHDDVKFAPSLAGEADNHFPHQSDALEKSRGWYHGTQEGDDRRRARSSFRCDLPEGHHFVIHIEIFYSEQTTNKYVKKYSLFFDDKPVVKALVDEREAWGSSRLISMQASYMGEKSVLLRLCGMDKNDAFQRAGPIFCKEVLASADAPITNDSGSIPEPNLPEANFLFNPDAKKDGE